MSFRLKKITMWLLFILILSGFLWVPGYLKLHKSELIQDYLKTEKSSNIFVIAFLCWDKVSKYKLWNNLSKNYFRTTIFSVNENYLQEYNPAQNIRYVVDLDCKNSMEFISKVSSNKLFSSPNKWFLLSKNEKIFKNLDQSFASVNILLDSYIVFAFGTQNNEYNLLEIYKINKNKTNINQNFIMKWTPEAGIINTENTNSLIIRKDLQKTAYKACFVVLDNDTFNHFDDYRSKHVDTATKATYLCFNHLIDYLNATKEYSFDTMWGYILEDGYTYNGMIGAVQQNRIDISGSPLFMRADRIPIIDYIPMNIPSRTKFIFRQPPLSYVANIFTLPFSVGVWISYIGLVIIASILLYFAVKFEWQQPDLDVTDMALRDSFMETLLFTVSGVSQQGYATEPRSGVGKLIMTFTFLALMFFYVSYSANIVVLLQTSSTSIQTLEDLLNSRLKMGVHDVVYNRYYFQAATEPIRKAIYDRKIATQNQNPNFLSMEEGIKRMRQGFYAFHVELGAAYKLVGDTFLESEKCGLWEIEYLDVIDPFLCVAKNSSYKEVVKIGFRKICETGLQSRELRKLYTKKPECNVIGARFVSVGLIDVYPAFMLLVIGVGLAVIINIFEIIIFKNCVFNKLQIKKENE